MNGVATFSDSDCRPPRACLPHFESKPPGRKAKFSTQCVKPFPHPYTGSNTLVFGGVSPAIHGTGAPASAANGTVGSSQVSLSSPGSGTTLRADIPLGHTCAESRRQFFCKLAGGLEISTLGMPRPRTKGASASPRTRKKSWSCARGPSRARTCFPWAAAQIFELT